MSKRVKTLIGAVVGLALGAALGWLAGTLVRSDNVPFFVVLGGAGRTMGRAGLGQISAATRACGSSGWRPCC